jgi:hypothetical protein
MKRTTYKVRKNQQSETLIASAPMSGVPVEILSAQDMIAIAGGKVAQMHLAPYSFGSFCCSKLLQ